MIEDKERAFSEPYLCVEQIMPLLVLRMARKNEGQLLRIGRTAIDVRIISFSHYSSSPSSQYT
jgi:hypothetical protein